MAKSIGSASLAACPVDDLAPRKQVMADLSREKDRLMLLISLAFENCVGHCACVSARFVLKSMRVIGRTQNAMFKRK